MYVLMYVSSSILMDIFRVLPSQRQHPQIVIGELRMAGKSFEHVCVVQNRFSE